MRKNDREKVMYKNLSKKGPYVNSVRIFFFSFS